MNENRAHMLIRSFERVIAITALQHELRGRTVELVKSHDCDLDK